MSMWGSADQANNSPMWAPAKLNKAPTRANANTLAGNTTADAYITGRTDGVFAVDEAESAAKLGAVPHTGWVLRTVGSGGRANRVQYEVLVAGGITGDSENTVFQQATITIVVGPTDKSVNTNSSTTLSVSAVASPANVTISYQWEANTGSGFANLTNSGVYSNVTTATLSISNTAGLNNYSYRVVLRGTGATNVTSANAKLTVT